MNRERILLKLINFCLILSILCLNGEANCRTSCGLALASYYVWGGSNLSYISTIFNQKVPEILKYNPQISTPDSIPTGSRINVPFSCDCLNGDFLGHRFEYKTQIGDTYVKIARIAFSNLTNAYWIQLVNTYDPTRVPDFIIINVTVNCSCGDTSVSKDYGLFATYPLHSGENLSSVATASGVPPVLLQRFNPGSDFSSGSGIVFVPAKG
ncbi:hypothetical protein M9H77_13360 [Catharanthus roseus]|uniref:Uncharacterized protein n=1 Tax=Catharanthus roseus TaxID=4058 RepID=A0ACC0BK92_CATRO|nr:hypothetical protein M9H77_13360 [Catharanthus roseus]